MRRSPEGRINRTCVACGKTFSVPASVVRYGAGLYCSRLCIVKTPSKIIGEKNGQWKGDGAGYVSKHEWLYRHFGRANMCEHCNSNKAKRFEWANISGKYKRNRNDWKMLCSICHSAFDKDKAARGEMCGSSKLKNKQVILIREKYSSGKNTLHSLAKEFCMSFSAIQSITSGKGWRHLL